MGKRSGTETVVDIIRVDNVMTAGLEGSEGYELRDEREVERFVGESLDGFHQGGPALEMRFRVRDPEARWVVNNLLEGMASEHDSGGIVVRARTSAPLRVARFVVGLGDAAEVETPLLREMVRDLARGALRAVHAFSDE